MTAPTAQAPTAHEGALDRFGAAIGTLLVVAVGLVLLVVVVGEQLGLVERVTDLVPAPIALGLVLVIAYPTLRGVVRDALRARVTSATLMSVGLIAALVVGQWATAILVVFFITLGERIESFTDERSRRALEALTALAPPTARLERDGVEEVVPVERLAPGMIVVVRPGEAIPADGVVETGEATLDQSTITGESLPVEVAAGARVYAATLARLGSLRVRVTGVGADTTFGRVVRLVEEAERNRGTIQRAADRFSGWYLPVVAGIAAVTFAVRHDPLATAAVLVVACSCSFALATPIAILAALASAARRGVIVKGGLAVEGLARVDVVLLDKTGTVTFGRPEVREIVARPGTSRDECLALAAAAERYSEHPFAEAIRVAARGARLTVARPERFEAIPGAGVRAVVDGRRITVGGPRLAGPAVPEAAALAAGGATVLVVVRDDEVIGVLALTDTLRPEVPAALAALRRLGITRIELLTGDAASVAGPLAAALGITYRAGLLPEDKIAIVREHQAAGRVVAMVGDGVNDAPALSQADVGIAMGVAGSPIAIDAARVALLRDDWRLVPETIAAARRTIGVVKLNLGFTLVYNLVGLSLAALGLLPPALAAAAQSLPDVIMLGNSARLLGGGRGRDRDSGG